jgi:hypothetical protein
VAVDRKIILFELNEVPYRVVEEYCRWHPESVLARRRKEFTQYETYAEDVGHLSPWKTWPSLHRGVPDSRHFIADFGQDLRAVDNEFPPLWKILTQHGVKTGVCGSLHTYPMPQGLENYAFFLPDTFAAGSECFPSELSLFQEFNLTMARESARNVSTRVPWKSALRLLRSAPMLGLRAKTFGAVGSQLVGERIAPWKKSRRRTYQAVLAFDILMKQLKRTKPAFATFFTNHVAASMHRFWAAAFPDDYEQFGYEPQWVNTYGHEIEFAMGKFDQFLADLLAFVDANKDYELWIATSMGQAATQALPMETQLYVTDLPKFMTALGLNDSEWERRPAMLPQCNFFVKPGLTEHVRERLKSLIVDDQPINFRESESGFFSVDFGHPNLYDKPQTVRLGRRPLSFAEMGLANVEIEDKSGASAYHIPQGCLFVYDPTDRATKEERPQMSALEIAPTLLRNFDVPVPEYMTRPAPLVPA